MGGAWGAAVHGGQRVRRDLVTEQQQAYFHDHISFSSSQYFHDHYHIFIISMQNHSVVIRPKPKSSYSLEEKGTLLQHGCHFEVFGPHPNPLWKFRAPLVAQMVKSPPAMQETQVQSLGGEDPLEERIATHSSILAWKTPWTAHG